jgi:hypothetical protein
LLLADESLELLDADDPLLPLDRLEPLEAD